MGGEPAGREGVDLLQSVLTKSVHCGQEASATLVHCQVGRVLADRARVRGARCHVPFPSDEEVARELPNDSRSAGDVRPDADLAGLQRDPDETTGKRPLDARSSAAGPNRCPSLVAVDLRGICGYRLTCFSRSKLDQGGANMRLTDIVQLQVATASSSPSSRIQASCRRGACSPRIPHPGPIPLRLHPAPLLRRTMISQWRRLRWLPPTRYR
jgi:hypothetical protein